LVISRAKCEVVLGARRQVTHLILKKLLTDSCEPVSCASQLFLPLMLLLTLPLAFVANLNALLAV
jgi:hypothetical protein